MPLVRAQVKNEYGLGVPELYKKINKEDPKATLDGVAVAGLVGILRQLGDLAEFAADVFHGLQEEVMSTASRSHKLMIRVQRIEAALPSLEKAVLAQTSHIHFAYTAGSEWHPRICNEKNHFIYNDLPRFIMDSYEVCRDPPRLHLLDKFDGGGPGSCLKRYSDPTYFERASGSSIDEEAEKIPRNKKTCKSKKRRSSHRNGDLSHGASLSNCSSRVQFTSPTVNGRTSSCQTASTVDMALKYDVEDRSNSFDSRTGSGYIEHDFNLCSHMRPEEQESKKVSSRLMHETNNDGSGFSVEQTQVVHDNFSHSSSQEQIAASSCVKWDEMLEKVQPIAGNWDRDEVPEMNFDVGVQETGAANLANVEQMAILFNDIDAPQLSAIENQNDEIESEPDNYMDALNTIESESENDIEYHTKREVEPCSDNDVDCQTKWEVEQSDYASTARNENRQDEMHVILDDNANDHQSITESSASSSIMSIDSMSRSLPDPVPSENFASEQMSQILGKSSDPGHSPSTDLCKRVHPENSSCEQMPQISGKFSAPDHSPSARNNSPAESVISDQSSLSGSTVSDTHDTTSDRVIKSINDSQNSQNRFSGVHSVGLWTNGGLLGLQPSKPPDFAVSIAAQGSVSKNSDAYGTPNQTPMSLHSGPGGNSGTVIGNAESTEKVTGLSSEKTSSHLTADLDANLEKCVNSQHKRSIDNFSGVGLRLNTSLSHGNEHLVNPNVKTAPIKSDEENDDNSSTMFGLGHKLSVNGFRRKVSIGHDCEAELAGSTKTEVLEPRNGPLGISSQRIHWTAFDEQIRNGSPVNLLTSSPPLEHMKISYNPVDGFETSKLKLHFPDGNHNLESLGDLFPSFQLVPHAAIPVRNVVSDTDDDTFCRSSPYVSDDCLSHCSESNSEQWESGGTPESGEPELYDSTSRFSSMESVSSSSQVVEAANNGTCVNGGNKIGVRGTGAEPSLSVLLNLPSFDAINTVLHDNTESNSDQKNQPELQNTTERTPLPVPPPPPPAKWRVSKPCFSEAEKRQHAISESLEHEPLAQWRASKLCLDEAEERQHALSESLRHELDLKLRGLNVSQKHKPAYVNQQNVNDEPIASKPEPEKKVDQKRLNGQRGANQLRGGRGWDEKEDFLHQIRTKSFNLRPTVTAKPTVTSGPTTNVKVTAILQKANAIRQAVGSDDDDDDDDDDDNWSDM